MKLPANGKSVPAGYAEKRLHIGGKQQKQHGINAKKRYFIGTQSEKGPESCPKGKSLCNQERESPGGVKEGGKNGVVGQEINGMLRQGLARMGKTS